MWKRLFRQPLPLPHLSLPLPLTENEKTTVDLSSMKFAMLVMLFLVLSRY